MKLITEYDKDARLILCVFARKHEKQNRQLHAAQSPVRVPLNNKVAQRRYY
jgi:hypothetical protein